MGSWSVVHRCRRDINQLRDGVSPLRHQASLVELRVIRSLQQPQHETRRPKRNELDRLSASVRRDGGENWLVGVQIVRERFLKRTCGIGTSKVVSSRASIPALRPLTWKSRPVRAYWVGPPVGHSQRVHVKDARVDRNTSPREQAARKHMVNRNDQRAPHGCETTEEVRIGGRGRWRKKA